MNIYTSIYGHPYFCPTSRNRIPLKARPSLLERPSNFSTKQNARKQHRRVGSVGAKENSRRSTRPVAQHRRVTELRASVTTMIPAPVEPEYIRCPQYGRKFRAHLPTEDLPFHIQMSTGAFTLSSPGTTGKASLSG